MYWTDRFQSASTFEHQCQGNDQHTGVCARIPGTRIPWSMGDASCLDEDLCIRTNSTPAKLDTGFNSSDQHLGINSPLGSSVEYSRVTQDDSEKTSRCGVDNHVQFGNLGKKEKSCRGCPFCHFYGLGHSPWLSTVDSHSISCMASYAIGRVSVSDQAGRLAWVQLVG